VEINQVPIPEPQENELLVRIASAPLCHSDLMLIGDAFVAVNRPKTVTLGYEGAGYIESLHPSAEGKGFKKGEGKGFKKGDAVGFLYIIRCCFECEGCMIHNNHCLRKQSLTQGFTFDGFFAEYALVDYHSPIALSTSLDVKTAAPIFCAGVTCKSWERALLISLWY
jgi:propanol-preferring alcohol dehydrogenase